MKTSKRFFVLTLLAVAMALPASAQFRWGPKVGIEVNKMHFNKELGNSDNQTGFTGGLMAEIQVPIIGICVDGSVMYARRNVKMDEAVAKRDFLDIPINLKYKFNFPVISRIAVPYLTTGPNFSFLLSKKNLGGEKKSNVAWSFGLGAELLSHLQIGASYNFDITKATDEDGVYGKNRYWVVSAAYLF